jgi:hemerythrin-like domain-containing protein
MLSRVETFKKCVLFLSSRSCRHHHRSTLERIRMDCEDHDAKGQIRQLLTSEHIDEEIRDLNRKISEAIQFVQVRLVKCTRQKADLMTLVAGFCTGYEPHRTPQPRCT